MIIDFHTHIFPDKLAGKVIPMLAERSGITPNSDGTFSDTCAKLAEWGFDGAVFLNIATAPRQQNTINNTAAEINNNKNYFAFGSVHPDAEDAVQELRRIKSMGIKGVKMHPEYQEFYLDEKRMLPIYEAAQDLGLIMIFHAGCDRGYPDICHAAPDKFLYIMKNFPRLKLVAAHFGGWSACDMSDYFLIGKDIYLDTSMTVGYMDRERMKKMLLRHDPDKILLASDCPWGNPAEALDHIYRMDLPDDLTEKIIGKNALTLLCG